MKNTDKKSKAKNFLYWLVEGIGLAILIISLITKIRVFFPKKEKGKEEKKK